MQIIKIDIEKSEAEEIEVNQYICTGYRHLLKYILNNTNITTANEFLQEKWQEALQAEINYAAIMNKVAEKYKPQSGYIDVKFNFELYYAEYLYD